MSENQNTIESAKPLARCATEGCPNYFEHNPKGNGAPRRYCQSCAVNRMSEQKLQSQKKIRAVSKEVNKVKDRLFAPEDNWNSLAEPTEEDAKEILAAERGLTKQSIVDRVYEFTVAACKQLKITPNAFVFRNGIAQSLASIEAKEPRPLVIEGDDYVPNEPLLWRKEVFAFWDAVEGWRKGGLNFEQYLEARYQEVDLVPARAKTLGKDFDEFDPDGPYREWSEFLPKWKPTLRPDYSQKELRAWLDSLTDVKNFLLIACRNSGKSHTIAIWLTAAFMCCGDLRVLLASETNPLSTAFCEGIIEWFVLKNPYELTQFQRLHPELLIDRNTGVYNHPLAHLGLFQPAMQSTSFESSGQAGQRCDILWASDPISDRTVATEDQRNKSISRKDALCELPDTGGIFVMDVTPWHPRDLSAVILERAERAGDGGLAYRIDPMVIIRPEARAKNIYDLVESDIESFLCPNRLGWKAFRDKRRDKDEYTFRSQSLCEFLDKDSDENQKLHFERVWFVSNTVPQAPQTGYVYGTCDMGFSKTKYRDPSAMTLFEVGDDKKLYVLTQEVGHWNTQEKAEVIVRLTRQYPAHFKTWIIEKPSNFEDIERAVKLEAQKYGVTVPIFWAPVDSVSDRKFYALKSMETPLAGNTVKFVGPAPYLDNLIIELEKLDDTGPKRRSRHDDCADSLQLGIRFLLPNPDDEAAEARKVLEEQQEKERRKREQYALVFEGTSRWNKGMPSTEAPSDSGREITVSRDPVFGIPGIRGFPGVSRPKAFGSEEKKTMSFGDLISKKRNS